MHVTSDPSNEDLREQTAEELSTYEGEVLAAIARRPDECSHALQQRLRVVLPHRVGGGVAPRTPVQIA